MDSNVENGTHGGSTQVCELWGEWIEFASIWPVNEEFMLFFLAILASGYLDICAVEFMVDLRSNFESKTTDYVSYSVPTFFSLKINNNFGYAAYAIPSRAIRQQNFKPQR